MKRARSNDVNYEVKLTSLMSLGCFIFKKDNNYAALYEQISN